MKVIPDTANPEVFRAMNLCLIRDRINAKSNKGYGPTHHLVVIVDDFLAFTEDRDLEVLKEFAELSLLSTQLDFKVLHFLGASGGHLFSYDLPRYESDHIDGSDEEWITDANRT